MIPDETKYHGEEAAGILPMAKDTCRFLLMRRSKYVFQPGTYGTIGGKMESFDDNRPRATAYREFIEETEYEGNVKLIRASVFKSPDGKFKYHNFLGIVDREFEPDMEQWENDAYEWVDLYELHTHKDQHFGLRAMLEDSKDLIEKKYASCLRRT